MKKTVRPIPTWSVWLLGALAVPAIFLVVLALQRGSLSATLVCFINEPILFVLNLWPIAATLILAICLTRNVFYGIGFTTFLWGVLSYINLVKVTSRGDPFVPGDILLLTEGMEAVGSYRLDLQLIKLFALLLLCLILVGCGLIWKTPKPRWQFRVAGGLFVTVAFVITMAFTYPSKSLYEGLDGPSRSNVPAVFDSFGFPYCFLHNFNLYPMDKPDGYDAQLAAQYEASYQAGQLPLAPPESADTKTYPNIIMLMCEAFTDLPNLDVFTWNEQENPIAAYNALAADPNTLSGHLIVSNIGAGTANTEFDILTGAMTNKLSPATSSAFRVVHRNTDSIPRMLNDIGYNTFFLHPGQNWFYNRESVYTYLGITDLVFEDAFKAAAQGGSWTSDATFLRVLQASLESRVGDAPLFTYGVTIQNHQSYTYSKYDFQPARPETALPLSETAEMYLSVYFQGLRDGSDMLLTLTQYLDTQEEPYLLVFFGDHQPNLGGSYLSYQELGLNYTAPTSTEETLSIYKVPYLIWSNEAYRQEGDLQSQAALVGLEDGAIISSHYLGALTCQLAGIQGNDGYFDYLNALRPLLPVCSIYGYRLPDGTWTDQLPQELAELEELRWHWQYYRLKTQKE